MNLNTVELANFRSYSKQSFSLGKTTIVVGPNGSGKSNLIEAIYLLATGKSFRADRDNEMVAYDQGFAKVVGVGAEIELSVILNDRKKFEVNGVARRMVDFVGNIRAVIFAPQDLDLITGSPSVRRRYLDLVLSQTDREYRRNLISYEKGLRQRNKLLDLIREGMAERSQLFFWDRLLIKNGEYLSQKRSEYLATLNTETEYAAVYDSSVISPARLEQYQFEEVAAATTLVGPHRDDFHINLQTRDVAKYGSRGEQRMAVLWLKKGEIVYLGSNPILLLDDIFSELDEMHRLEVMLMITNYSGQVIMTAVDQSQPGLDHGDLTLLRLGD